LDSSPSFFPLCSSDAFQSQKIHSRVARLSRSPRGSKLLEETGTQPKITYLARLSWNGDEENR
jgi:hypothetical protein